MEGYQQKFIGYQNFCLILSRCCLETGQGQIQSEVEGGAACRKGAQSIIGCKHIKRRTQIFGLLIGKNSLVFLLNSVLIMFAPNSDLNG